MSDCMRVQTADPLLRGGLRSGGSINGYDRGVRVKETCESHEVAVQCAHVLRSPRGKWLESASDLSSNVGCERLPVAYLQTRRSRFGLCEQQEGRFPSCVSIQCVAIARLWHATQSLPPINDCPFRLPDPIIAEQQPPGMP
jgi:hypothetical protein